MRGAQPREKRSVDREGVGCRGRLVGEAMAVEAPASPVGIDRDDGIAGVGEHPERGVCAAAGDEVGAVADESERAQRLVAEFRADIGRQADQAPLAGLIGELTEASLEFRQWWGAQQVQGRDGGLRRFQQAQQGLLEFNQLTLHLARQHDLKLVMLLPVS